MTNTVVDSVGNKLLKALLTELQMLSPRFQHMNTEAQLEIIDRLRLQVQDQLLEAVSTIAARSYRSVPCTIIKVQFKDGVQVQVNMNRTNRGVHDVADAIGTEAMLVLCDMDQFVGGMDTIKPASPQKDAFGGDDD